MNRQEPLEAHSFYTACPVCSQPPERYQFNSHDIKDATALTQDAAVAHHYGASVDPTTGHVAVTEHDYSVRDGALLALERPGHQSDDMLWAFVAPSERQGVVDLKNGEVVEVVFDEPFEDALAVSLYQIPHRVTRPDYGRYAVQWAVDALTPERFVLLSSYYEDSPRTDERAFIVGWRAFGRKSSDEAPPVWRDMLSNAHSHLLQHRWHLALLEAAFALESFIDSLAAGELGAKGVPDFFIAEALREDDLPVTLRAVADMRGYPQLTRSAADKLAHDLRKEVFTPRNKIAHGTLPAHSVDEHAARAAVNRMQQVAWDWSREDRLRLLLVNRAKSLDDLRDLET